MKNADRAVICFKQGFSCSQAILSTYGERFGLQRDAALRVAGAFGHGHGTNGKYLWRGDRRLDGDWTEVRKAAEILDEIL